MNTIVSNQLNCKNCNKPTQNPKFCSRSCAATYNNRTTPKRTRQVWRCSVCDKPGRKSNSEVFDGCVSCYLKSEDERTGNMTLGESLNLTGHLRSRYNTVRHHGRKLSRLYDRCQVCDYSVVVQVCHIKPIHTFDLETPLKVINDPSNIAILCPNHHWELDHGFLSPDAVPARP